MVCSSLEIGSVVLQVTNECIDRIVQALSRLTCFPIPSNTGEITCEQVTGVIEPDECAEHYANLVLHATMAEHGGKFLGYGFAEPIPW